MQYFIRPFRDHDYKAMIEIHDLCFPHSFTIEEQQNRDRTRDPRCQTARWVAEVKGRVLAWGGYSQDPVVYNPRGFGLSIHVHPGHQRRGVGTSMYHQIRRALVPFSPEFIVAIAREDYQPGMSFLAKLGFAETHRRRSSTLDVNSFNFTQFADVEQKVTAQGIECRSLQELKSDPDYERKLYALNCEIDRDLYAGSDITEIPFDRWLDTRLHNPKLQHEGSFVGVDGDRYVGFSTVASDDDGCIRIGVTGVVKNYRRRGIALVLKIAGLRWCVANRIRKLRTSNEDRNIGIVSLNKKLGFVPGPASIAYEKTPNSGDLSL
jgi:GNAT superfamily N-acetyltransferase